MITTPLRGWVSCTARRTVKLILKHDLIRYPFEGLADRMSLRHAAVRVRQDTLWVFYSRIGDVPESALLSHVPLQLDWNTWQASLPDTVLRPKRTYEGGELPTRPSERGAIYERVKQLRDPAVYVEGDRAFLFYAVRGEGGIAISNLIEN